MYRTLVPARSCARLENDEATGAMMASVHDASVSHAATVSFASAANDAAGLSVCHVATARSPALLHSGSIVYMAGLSLVTKRGALAQTPFAAFRRSSGHGLWLRKYSTQFVFASASVSRNVLQPRRSGTAKI